MFDFFKKEKPFQGFNGFGGGAAGLGMFSGKAEITGGTKSTARSGNSASFKKRLTILTKMGKRCNASYKQRSAQNTLRSHYF